MTVASEQFGSDTFEPLGTRLARWLAAVLLALLFHAGAIAALLFLAAVLGVPEDAGFTEIDLPPIAMQPTAAEAENAENPEDNVTSPTPAAGPKLEETPIEDVAEAEPPPEDITPEAVPEELAPPVTEPIPEPLETAEDIAPVEEAPLAPEPEVNLPKEVAEAPKPEPVKPREPERKVERKERVEKKEPRKEKPEKPSEKPVKKAEAAQKSKSDGPKKDKAKTSGEDSAAPGSKAKGKASSAAASGGKFSASPISRPHPPYPSGARSSRIEGSVTVSMTIAPSGAVTSVSVISSSPPGVFNGVVTSTLRQWRFKPSATGGRKTQRITFKLK